MIKPVLRYHGAKWMLSKWIAEHFPTHRVYNEPFCGSAALLIRKEPAYAEIINDIHDGVVNFFKVLRDTPHDLKRVLELTPFSETEFYSALDYEISDSLEWARQFAIRSYMGFGSNSVDVKTGFRSNSNRSGSTPAKDWLRYPSRLIPASERLRGVIVHNSDYKKVCTKHDTYETLHFVDPPYLKKTRTAKNGYKYDLDDEEQIDMLNFLKTLKGRVVLCGYPSELYDRELKGWKQFQKNTFACGAKPRTEILYLNANAFVQLAIDGKY